MHTCNTVSVPLRPVYNMTQVHEACWTQRDVRIEIKSILAFEHYVKDNLCACVLTILL